MLTDEEIVACWNVVTGDEAYRISMGEMCFARAIEAEVIERCALVCDEEEKKWQKSDREGGVAEHLAATIRAMKP